MFGTYLPYEAILLGKSTEKMSPGRMTITARSSYGLSTLYNTYERTTAIIFCIGVAGYPEGHADESHPEAGKQSVEHDLPHLVEKVKAGADFIMTQLTYDVDAYARYEERLRNFKDNDGNAIFERIPIIPGLMPIQSYQIVKRITKLSHSKLPSSISERIEQVRSDDERVKRVGVDIVSEVVEEIKKLSQPQGLPRGMHFYTLNLEKSVTFILERCDMITPSQELTPGESSDSDAIDDKMPAVNGTDEPSPRFSRRRASSVNAQPHNRVILDSKSPPRPPNPERPPALAQHEARDRGTGIPASEPTRKHNLMISEGQGALGREATWDDFPNGRWGPSQSASWGEIDGYGPTLKVGPATARKLWGHPKSVADITNLFRKHLLGEVLALAWSDEVEPDGVTEGSPALRPETATIRDELLALIDRKYWTVASQPSVDGVSSEHPTYGWGPKGEGWVYQKAFCEFFCSKTEWENSLKPKLMKTAVEEVSWMAVDGDRTFESSETVTVGQGKPSAISSKRTPGSSGVNAVTWGVFRGREITVSTLIDSQSFRAWAEEAFELWFAWARCFPKGSDEQKFLRTLRDELMLVSVIGQRYVGEDGQRLWKLLLDD